MANIAVQRIKREFKEVLKSEEVCKTLLYSILSNKRTFGDRHSEANELA